MVVLTDGDLKEYETRLSRKTKISRIYNPIAYHLENNCVLEKKNIILTVGRLVPAKGTEYIKEVALRVLKNQPHWQWIILGDGEERSNLEQFIAENNLQDKLILEGCVKNVDDYLRKASIFVLTSKYEGPGLSILEAREMMVPCVAFNVKMGPKELINDGVDGYLVKPFNCDEMAEKIETLIGNRELRERFAEKAFSHLDEFCMDKIKSQWKEVLKPLL